MCSVKSSNLTYSCRQRGQMNASLCIKYGGWKLLHKGRKEPLEKRSRRLGLFISKKEGVPISIRQNSKKIRSLASKFVSWQT